MPFRKRTYTARRRFGRSYRKKRYYKKKSYKRVAAKARKFNNGNVHRFTRYSNVGYLECVQPYDWGAQEVGGGGAPGVAITGHCANKAFVFSLSDVVHSEEFGSLFDQYRILSAVVEIQPLLTPASMTGTGGTQMVARWFYDHDDDSTLGMSGADADEFWGQRAPLVKETPFRYNRPIIIPVIPTTQTMAPQDEGNVYAPVPGVSGKRRMWLDMTFPDVPHYGLKFQVLRRAQLAAEVGPIAQYRIKYNLEFKNPR